MTTDMAAFLSLLDAYRDAVGRDGYWATQDAHDAVPVARAAVESWARNVIDRCAPEKTEEG